MYFELQLLMSHQQLSIQHKLLYGMSLVLYNDKFDIIIISIKYIRCLTVFYYLSKNIKLKLVY